MAICKDIQKIVESFHQNPKPKHFFNPSPLLKCDHLKKSFAGGTSPSNLEGIVGLHPPPLKKGLKNAYGYLKFFS